MHVSTEYYRAWVRVMFSCGWWKPCFTILCATNFWDPWLNQPLVTCCFRLCKYLSVGQMGHVNARGLHQYRQNASTWYWFYIRCSRSRQTWRSSASHKLISLDICGACLTLLSLLQEWMQGVWDSMPEPTLGSIAFRRICQICRWIQGFEDRRSQSKERLSTLHTLGGTGIHISSKSACPLDTFGLWEQIFFCKLGRYNKIALKINSLSRACGSQAAWHLDGVPPNCVWNIFVLWIMDLTVFCQAMIYVYMMINVDMMLYVHMILH